jgi:hypothetical protein
MSNHIYKRTTWRTVVTVGTVHFNITSSRKCSHKFCVALTINNHYVYKQHQPSLQWWHSMFCARNWTVLWDEMTSSSVYWYQSIQCEPRMHYSGTLIYRSRNDHFPACTVRHFWPRMKFHINNVIYSRIHRSLNYRFTALIVCKSRSWPSISRMDRLEKKLKRSIYYLLYLLFGL